MGQRDAVIASGSINPNTHLSIALSDFSKPGLNLVRADVGYSIEVTSAFPEARTTAQPVAASINRFDYNASTGESFLNPTTLVLDSAPKSWDLPRIERNSLSREYIVYQNLSNTATTVTTVFHTAAGDVFVARPLGPYRRGGLEVFSLGLPDGVLWANVFSDQNIVVALSDWDLPSPLNTTAVPQQGFLVMGRPLGQNRRRSYALGPSYRNDFTSNVSIVNYGSDTFTVTLNFRNRSGLITSTKHLVIAPGGACSDLDLDSADIGIPVGQLFSITYPGYSFIAAQYTSFSRTPGLKQDGIASAFGTSIPPVAYFADGELDPTLCIGAQTETISILNTFNGSSTFDFTYTVRYYFSDGTTIDAAAGSLNQAPGGRVDIVSGNTAACGPRPPPTPRSAGVWASP